MRTGGSRRQRELRCLYYEGWSVLSAWATCTCPEGACPIAAELERLGVEPGDLLAALALGQPALIGVKLWML